MLCSGGMQNFKYVIIFISLYCTRSEMKLPGKSVRSWRDGSSDRSLMVDPLSYFSFQLVLHDWCNKGRGICYPVCAVMHIKEPLLLIGKRSPFAAAGFLSRYLSGPLPYV